MTVWFLVLVEAVSVGGVGLFLVAGCGCKTFLFLLGLGWIAAISGNSESELELESLLDSGSDSEEDEKIVFWDREEDGGGRDNLAMVLWFAVMLPYGSWPNWLLWSHSLEIVVVVVARPVAE